MRTKPVVIAAAAAVAVVLAADPADAGRRSWRRSVRIDLPEALPSSGPSLVLAFSTRDDGRERDTDIQAQYALDRNQDGLLTEDEWLPATEDRADPRSTRAPAAPFLFASGSGQAVQNAFVWNTLADVSTSPLLTLEYALDTHGRPIPDPDNPGAFLLATTPAGSPLIAGVRIRIRAVTPRRGHRRPWRGAWIVSDAFTVDNRSAPSMTIDEIDAGSPLLVHWTVFDADSEDVNGNGQFDVDDGEDKNGNGLLDAGRVGVAFDFHVVGDGEDPAGMSNAGLAALSWSPCTRVAGVGDTDSLDARFGVPIPTTGDLSGVMSAPPPVGRQWVFAWDPAQDSVPAPRGFILRATPFDETRAIGATVYSRTIVQQAQ